MITLPARSSAGLPRGRMIASCANRATNATTEQALDKSLMDQDQGPIEGPARTIHNIGTRLEQKKNKCA